MIINLAVEHENKRHCNAVFGLSIWWKFTDQWKSIYVVYVRVFGSPLEYLNCEVLVYISNEWKEWMKKKIMGMYDFLYVS